jgi:hypothetical protein
MTDARQPRWSSFRRTRSERRCAAVRNRSTEQTFFDEERKTLSQNCFRVIEVGVKVGEPLDAVERVAQNEQRPAFVDDLPLPGDRAFIGGIMSSGSVIEPTIEEAARE